MHNIVLRKSLTSAGMSNRVICGALDCCLMQLSPGLFTIIAHCEQNSHSPLRRFIDDEEWLATHAREANSPDGRSDEHFEYERLVHRMRIVNYQHFRPDDVVWGLSAAFLHGIPLFDVSKDEPVVVINPHASSRSASIIRRRRPVDESDVETMNRLRISTRIRTAFELIRQQGQQGGFAALEWTLRRSLLGPTDPTWLRRGYPEDFTLQGRRRVFEQFIPVIDRLTIGRVTARRLVDQIDPRSERLSESYCSFNLHELGIEGVDQQVDIYDRRGFIARVDFVDHATRTIIEVDGVTKYLGRDQMSRQTYQHNRLLALGYVVVRFRFADLLNLNTFAAKLFAQAPALARRRTA